MRRKNSAVQFRLICCLLAIIGFSARGSVGFSGVKGGTNTGKSTNNYTENNISASAATNWEFRSATASPAAHKDASFTTGSASTSTKSGIYFNYVNFTVVMSGTIVPVGPGSGPPPPTDYTLSISNPTTTYTIEPTEKIIVTSSSATFYAKVDMEISDPAYKVSDWSFIPSSYEVDGETTTVQGKLGVTSATVGSAGWPTPDAGLYSIRCLPSPSAEANPPSATASLHVVEITKPAKNGSASKWETGSYRYDCQAVESGTSGAYNLGVTGNWASRSDGQWSLSAVKGTIASATSSQLHIPRQAHQEVWI